MNLPAWYRVVDTDTNLFSYLPTIFLFPKSLALWSIKNVSTAYFLISSSTKKTEFGHVKFPESITSEDGVS